MPAPAGDLLGMLPQQLELFVLVFSRILGVLVTAPLLANRFVPVYLRVAVALVVAGAVLPALVGASHPEPRTLLLLAPLVVAELLLGMIVGFVSTLALAAVQLGGELLDIDLGFAIANVLDPTGNTHLPLVGTFHYTVALLIYVSMDGHHWLLRAMARSYRAVPVGGVHLTDASLQQVLAAAADLFVSGLELAAPVFATLLLTTVAMAVTSRAVPQLNVFMTGLPLKVLVGLAMLAAGLPLYAAVLERVLIAAHEGILRLIGLLGGGG